MCAIATITPGLSQVVRSTLSHCNIMSITRDMKLHPLTLNTKASSPGLNVLQPCHSVAPPSLKLHIKMMCLTATINGKLTCLFLGWQYTKIYVSSMDRKWNLNIVLRGGHYNSQYVSRALTDQSPAHLNSCALVGNLICACALVSEQVQVAIAS